jgi:hypothetical protein
MTQTQRIKALRATIEQACIEYGDRAAGIQAVTDPIQDALLLQAQRELMGVCATLETLETYTHQQERRRFRPVLQVREVGR